MIIQKLSLSISLEMDCFHVLNMEIFVCYHDEIAGFASLLYNTLSEFEKYLKKYSLVTTLINFKDK